MLDLIDTSKRTPKVRNGPFDYQKLVLTQVAQHKSRYNVAVTTPIILAAADRLELPSAP